MLESSLEMTIIGTAVALWFALGWYMNDRLKKVHEKLDGVHDKLNGLRAYLYEIDPQFADERALSEQFYADQGGTTTSFSGAELSALRTKKKQHGVRNLDTPFN